ncbi:hypothetical protein [Flagellimonas sp. GZD32]|uniref:hypothetical protein n=1 Tax=Flagellimonas cixiensis TaxID=3228750 RepID=UPI0035C89953
MRNTIVFTCIFLLFQTIHSQYESSYIVTNDGVNKIGLIKNQNWNNNPEKIIFRTNLDDPDQTIEITNLSEFGIGDNIKFSIHKVDLDISAENINQLSRDKNPIFEKRTVALKVLVDGKISIFEYQFSNGTRFYVKQSDGNVEPLIFKKYMVSANQIGTNEHYKQQLSLLFLDQKEDFTNKLERLSYSRKSLSKIVTEYNLSNNSGSFSFVEPQEKKTKINLSVHAGLEQTSVDYQFRNVATLNPSFTNISRSMFGAELQLLLLNDKLGIFSSYTIKSAVSETIDLQTSIADKTQKATLSYNNNTVSIGARGYIPTFKNINLIVSAGVIQEIVSNFSITLEISEINENYSRNAVSGFFGCGLSYKRLFGEVRFFNNKMFPENVSNSTEVNNSNLNFRLGYKIL